MDDQLKQQMSEMDAMVRRRKVTVASALNRGDDVPAAELSMIARLELQLANLRALVRLRELSA